MSRSSPTRTVALLMAFSSAILFTVFVFKDLGDLVSTNPSDVPWGLVLRYFLAMGIAGGLVGAVLSGLFGRRGPVGWALSLVAGVIVATIAGMLGSFFGGLPNLMGHGMGTGAWIAILSGSMVLPFVVSDWPLLGVAWLALLGVTHLRARRLRQSSD